MIVSLGPFHQTQYIHTGLFSELVIYRITTCDRFLFESEKQGGKQHTAKTHFYTQWNKTGKQNMICFGEHLTFVSQAVA